MSIVWDDLSSSTIPIIVHIPREYEGFRGKSHAVSTIDRVQDVEALDQRPGIFVHDASIAVAHRQLNMGAVNDIIKVFNQMCNLAGVSYKNVYKNFRKHDDSKTLTVPFIDGIAIKFWDIKFSGSKNRVEFENYANALLGSQDLKLFRHKWTNWDGKYILSYYLQYAP